MSYDSRPGARHPLCTCPRQNRFPGMIVRQPDCPGGSIAHPAPLTAEQVRELVAHSGNRAGC